MTHALVMECLVLEPFHYSIFYSRKEQMILNRDIIKANETKNYWIWSGGFLRKEI